AGDVVFDVGVDGAVLGVDGEEDGTFEAVLLGENLAELRQRFFGAILLIAAEEDDVLALSRPVGAVVNDPLLLSAARCRRGEEHKAYSESSHHGLHVAPGLPGETVIGQAIE